MNTQKKRILWLSITAALSLVILVLVFFLRDHKPSAQYSAYQNWSVNYQVGNYTFTESEAKTFAHANCKNLSMGYKPGWIIKNDDHLKATAAVFKAYCPIVLDNYLTAVKDNPRYDGEFDKTIVSIRKANAH